MADCSYLLLLRVLGIELEEVSTHLIIMPQIFQNLISFMVRQEYLACISDTITLLESWPASRDRPQECENLACETTRKTTNNIGTLSELQKTSRQRKKDSLKRC